MAKNISFIVFGQRQACFVVFFVNLGSQKDIYFYSNPVNACDFMQFRLYHVQECRVPFDFRAAAP